MTDVHGNNAQAHRWWLALRKSGAPHAAVLPSHIHALLNSLIQQYLRWPYHGDVPAEVRLLKLTEEVGEAAEAFIGMRGLFSELH